MARGSSRLAVPFFFRPLGRWKVNLQMDEICILGILALYNLVVFFCYCSIADLMGLFSGSAKQVGKALGSLIQWNFLPLLLPITHCSIPYLVTHCTYDRVIFFHKWIGRWIFTATAIHLSVMVYWYFSQHTLWAELTKLEIIYGELAFLFMILLTFFSLKKFRKHLFEFFMKSHYFFMVLILVFSGLHKHGLTLLYILLGPVILYIIDVSYRFTRMFLYPPVTTARIITERHVRMDFHNLAITPVAGNYAYLYIPEVSPIQLHPFSFAFCPTNVDRSSSFIIECTGNWGKRLYRMVQERSEKENNGQPEGLVSMKVYLDGPHGTLATRTPTHYRYIVLFGMGTGITPMLSIIDSVMHYNRQQSDEEKKTKVVLHWVARGKGLFCELLDTLKEWESEESGAYFEKNLYLTDKSKPKKRAPNLEELELVDSDTFINHRCRPPIMEIFKNLVSDCDIIGVHRVGIYACGYDKFKMEIVAAGQHYQSLLPGKSGVRFDFHLESHSK